MHNDQQTKPQALKFGALLGVSMLAPVVLLWLISSPPGINVVWDWANGMGYLAGAICLILFIYKGRARSFPAFSGRFFANLHRHLGYLVAFLLLGHVGLLLVVEPLLLEHLKPTAPLHMLAGLIALILMLLLVLSSVPGLRRRLWPDYHVFRHVHTLVAVAATALLIYHVWGSGFYLNETWKTALLFVVSAGVIVYYLGGKYSAVAHADQRQRDSARYSHWVAYGCVSLLVLISLAAAVLVNFE